MRIGCSRTCSAWGTRRERRARSARLNARASVEAQARANGAQAIVAAQAGEARIDVDAAFASLERACTAGDPWLDAVTVDPRFACLRDDDRLRAIRARLRLD